MSGLELPGKEVTLARKSLAKIIFLAFAAGFIAGVFL